MQVTSCNLQSNRSAIYYHLDVIIWRSPVVRCKSLLSLLLLSFWILADNFYTLCYASVHFSKIGTSLGINDILIAIAIYILVPNSGRLTGEHDIVAPRTRGRTNVLHTTVQRCRCPGVHLLQRTPAFCNRCNVWRCPRHTCNLQHLLH